MPNVTLVLVFHTPCGTLTAIALFNFLLQILFELVDPDIIYVPRAALNAHRIDIAQNPLNHRDILLALDTGSLTEVRILPAVPIHRAVYKTINIYDQNSHID